MSQPQSQSTHDFELGDDEFHEIRRIVHRITGIALSDTKKHLVHGRLVRRLRALRISGFRAYLERIESDAQELEEFCNALTTNLTSFFRESHHFDYLAGTVLPLLQRRNASTRRIRIWSAGCSTGEEPYSIAMTVLETVGHLRDWDIRILATDIDSKVVATAQAGSYALDRFEKMSSQRRERYFDRSGEGANLVAGAELKRLISFRRLNLIEPWPVKGPFDVIFCRNVVIYFDKPTQRTLFDRMAELQRDGDHLFIGHSESLFNVCDRYELIAQTIHRKVR
jgi:chemotaxis protein methyltransferase CheR